MLTPCEVSEQAAQPMVSVRGRTSVASIPQFIGRAYEAVFGYLGELGEPPAGMPFAIYYNMDFEDMDVAAGIAVSHPLPGRGDVQPGELPGGSAVSALYTGPYEGLESAYAEMGKFIQEQGLQPTGMAIEYYLNGPENPPEKLQTRIVFPLS